MNIKDNVLSDKTRKIKYGLLLKFLIVTGMLCISFAAKSQDQAGVSLKTARDVAVNYCLKTVDRYSGSPAVVLNLDLAETRTSGKNTVWYVFNINKEEGYIIISADINTTPVLCYVPRGSYNIYPESRSPAFNEWLDALVKQIEYNLNYGIKNDTYQDLWNSYLSKGAMDSETMVLKMTTEWDQDAYFNAYSPQTGVGGHPASGSSYANRAPTGCVATAMGQIMKYYQWPSTVSGSHSYTDEANPNSNSSCGSADPSYGLRQFLDSGTPFDYSLMDDVPESVNYEISRLLYNSAVSVNMDFAYCQSWTNTSQVEEALESHFGYSTDAKYIVRADYDYNEWLDAIRYQIRNERPVQYRGQSSDGTVGHSFICYGYKIVTGETQLLFNFGWTGESAVFLSLPGLTSYGLGYNNGAVVDIFPTSQPDLTIPSASSSASTISSGTPFNVSFRVSNNGTRNAGEYTVSCYLSSDAVLDREDVLLADKEVAPLNIGQSIDDSFAGISIGDEPSGSYYLLVEADSEHDVHESDEGNNIYYNIPVTVTGTPAYDYRTVATGNWTGTSTWERYEEGTWKTTTAHPTKSSGKITIRSGHNVTVPASISVDEVTVETGGTVTVSEGATLTVATGHDEIDFLVNGTVVNEGTVSSIGVLSFSNGSTYEHKVNGGSIPIATWALTSNCNVTGMTNNPNLTIPSSTQPFGNFTWNCTNQVYTLEHVNLAGQLRNIAGNFYIVSTGSTAFLRLGFREDGDLTVNGNFSQTGGRLAIAGHPNTRKMIVKGDFSLAVGGTIYISPYSGTGILDVGGDFTSAGTFNITYYSAGNAPATINVAGDCSITGGDFYMSRSTEIGTLNVAGNLYHTGGTIRETSSGSGNIVFNGSEKQIFATTGEIYGEIDFTVNNGSYLQLATPETYITGAGSFELKDGATLGITSSAGITETGSGYTGNIRVTGTRNYSNKANYIYNGIDNQSTGSGLPSTVNNLTFNNSGKTVTFTGKTTVTNNFSVTTGSKAGLGPFTHETGRLTLGGIGKSVGTYGSTGSTAPITDDTYFAISTGIVINYAPPGSWLGVTTEWNNGTNWSGGIPGEATNVVIDSAVTNQPLISVTGTAACNDLTINPGASLSIDPGQALTVNGTLTNSGTLKLYSDASDIASLLLEDTSPVEGRNEIYLHLTGGGSPGNYAWHYISFPFTNGVAVSEIVDGRTDFNLAMYDESIVENSQNDGWVAWDGYIYSSGNTGGAGFTTMQPGYGYAHYYPTEQTYTVRGTINSGQMNVPLTFNTEASGRNPNIVGFNLVGNPFTCAIDWDEVVDFNGLTQSSEIHSAIYSYDLEGGQARYPAYVPEGPGTAGGSRYIPPTQAFFVETDSPGQTLIFPVAAKLHNTAPRFKGASDNTKVPMIRLLLDDGQVSRDAVVWFNEKASLQFDNRFDARSLGKGLGKMSIWTKLNGADYSINGIPWPETSVEIPVAIHSSAGGAFTIRPQDLNGLESFSVTLLDKVTKNSADLKTGGALSFTTGSGMIENRFVLIISDLVTGSESGLKNDNQFTIYELKGLLNIIPLSDTWNGKNGSIRILDLTGRSISLFSNIEFTKNTPVQRPMPAVKGIYFIEVRSGAMKHIGRVITK